MAFYTTTVNGKWISKCCSKIARGLVFYVSKNACSDIQTHVFRNPLAKERDTWTNARSIVRTNFIRQKFRERLCRSSNLLSRLCTLWTHSLAGVKDMIFSRTACQILKTSTDLSVLYWRLVFETLSTETSFWLSLVVETGKTYPGIAAYSTFQNRNRGGQCKVLLPLIKKPHL